MYTASIDTIPVGQKCNVLLNSNFCVHTTNHINIF